MGATILFLAANPRDQSTLGLDKELRAIEEKLRASGHGEVFALRSAWAVRPDDLLRIFNEEAPTIVHYSGHGSEENELLLTDENDQTAPVKGATLAKLFALVRDKTRVVLFNACYSEGQARAIVEHVECAIGMHTAVGDRAAIAFASAFYRALATGRAVQEAFEQGRLAIELEGLTGKSTPRLIARKDVDPARVFVLAPGSASAPAEWRAHAPPAERLGKGRERHALLLHRSPDRTRALQAHDELRHEQRVTALAGGEPEAALLERSLAALLFWSEEAAGRARLAETARALDQRPGEGPRLVALSLDGSTPPWGKKHTVLHSRERATPGAGPRAGELLRLLHALHESELDQAGERFAAELDAAEDALARDIQVALLNGRPQEIVELFERGGLAWQITSAPGCQAAQALLSLGALEPAHALLEALATRFPAAVRPQQLVALSLARRGSAADLEQAQRILARLVAAGERDPETLGIYARTWTDRYERTRDKSDLLQSRDHYAQAFELAPDDAFVGINAAAKSVLAGELERGRALAATVSALLEGAVGPGRGGYWERASAAEAQLILGELARAAELYAGAVASARQERGSHESSWKQACRLRARLAIGEAQWKPLREAFAHLPDWSTF